MDEASSCDVCLRGPLAHIWETQRPKEAPGPARPPPASETSGVGVRQPRRKIDVCTGFCPLPVPMKPPGAVGRAWDRVQEAQPCQRSPEAFESHKP